MMGNKPKSTSIIYFSALHLSLKVTNNDVKFKAISLLTNLFSLILLGFSILISRIVVDVYNVNINFKENIIIFFIGLVFLSIVVNIILNKIFKSLIELPLPELMKIKSTLNPKKLSWLFPLLAVTSIIILIFSAIVQLK